MRSVISDIREYLADHLDAPVHVNVPKTRPDEFVIVIIQNSRKMPPPLAVPTLGVQAWANTKAEADALLRQAADVLDNATADAGMTFIRQGTPTVLGTYDGTHERCQITYDVAVCL